MTEKYRNVLLTIQFDGSRYSGFQVQKNAPSIMKTVQNAVEQVLHTRWDIKGCSRTDAGVHATKYCISMKFQGRIPAHRLIRALNQWLPDDIAVIDAMDVPLTFHARYNCLRKEYTYLVHNSFIKDAFHPEQAYLFRYPQEIDHSMLHEQAQDFVGTKDFTSFCADLERTEDMVRTIDSVTVSRQGAQVTFVVVGDGFLYHMVRIMIGTLLDISIGRLAKGSIPAILEAKNRLAAGVTAPAKGLYLSNVIYPEEVFLDHE